MARPATSRVIRVAVGSDRIERIVIEADPTWTGDKKQNKTEINLELYCTRSTQQ